MRRARPLAVLGRGLIALVALPALLAVLLAGCGSTGSTTTGPLEVVAAESTWGSLVAQVGGTHVHVTSVVSSPAADPHAYEPRVSDAIAFARSRLAVVNGIGYDGWASRLLAADPAHGRTVIDVGSLLGLGSGANPHQWYSPQAVRRVIAAVARALARLDPRDAGAFARNERTLVDVRFRRYDALLRAIRDRYPGVSVGYSESIFAPLGVALGLRLATPASFARAVAEDGEVSAGDLLAVEQAIARHTIAVWVFNGQNVTPEVEHVTHLARVAGIPVVRVTETLSPVGVSFEDWQATQLEALLSALRRGTAR